MLEIDVQKTDDCSTEVFPKQNDAAPLVGCRCSLRAKASKVPTKIVLQNQKLAAVCMLTTQSTF